MSQIKFNLALARVPSTPSDFFIQSANQCNLNELNIQNGDVYGDYSATTANDSWLRKFELEVAHYFGKEAAIFLPSGVMAQNIALKISQKGDTSRTKFVCHHTSHLLIHEQAAYQELLQMSPYVVGQANAKVLNLPPLLYEDVKPLLEKQGVEKPTTVIVEVPHREIGGKCTSWADLESLSTHCQKAGIMLHMDGARLWEATGALGESLIHPSGGVEGSTRESLCGLFDSLYVSFYKGLGGVTGAMLIGSQPFIEEARVWNRRFGGNVYSLMPLAVSCWSGFRDNKDTFKTKKERLQEVIELLSDSFVNSTKCPPECCDIAGNSLLRFDPPVPQVSMIHVYVRCDSATAMKVREAVLAETGISCFTRIRPAAHSVYTESYFEMNMGPANSVISNEVWMSGWRAFLTALSTHLKRA